MSSVNLGNGSVVINDKKYAINWTGQYAQHIAENYLNGKPQHNILHVEIQQVLSKAKNITKDGKRTYHTYSETKNGIIFVAFVKNKDFVDIITGYKINEI